METNKDREMKDGAMAVNENLFRHRLLPSLVFFASFFSEDLF
jgi:hypothetical protein